MTASGMRLVLLGRPGSGKGTRPAMLPSGWVSPRSRPAIWCAPPIGQRQRAGPPRRGHRRRGRALVDDETMGESCASGWPRTTRRRLLCSTATRAPCRRRRRSARSSTDGRDSSTAVLHDRRRRGRAGAPAAGSRRADDTEDVIRHRLRVYREQTEPLVEHYRSDGAAARDRRPPVDREVSDQALRASRAVGRRSRDGLKTPGEIDLMDGPTASCTGCSTASASASLPA